MQVSYRWYGISAVGVLVVGFLRVVYFEKGSAYYFGNPFFYAKLGLFVAVGLLSIYPTLRFIKWRSQMAGGAPPAVAAAEYKALRAVLSLELALLLGMVWCAALMARGVTPGGQGPIGFVIRVLTIAAARKCRFRAS